MSKEVTNPAAAARVGATKAGAPNRQRGVADEVAILKLKEGADLEDDFMFDV